MEEIHLTGNNARQCCVQGRPTKKGYSLKLQFKLSEGSRTGVD